MPLGRRAPFLSLASLIPAPRLFFCPSLLMFAIDLPACLHACVCLPVVQGTSLVRRLVPVIMRMQVRTLVNPPASVAVCKCRVGRPVGAHFEPPLTISLSLSIVGKQVIVCAHRHTKKEADNQWGQGRCFTLSQSLQHATTWDPCAGRDKSRSDRQSCTYTCTYRE